jgi:hypothetical protein
LLRVHIHHLYDRSRQRTALLVPNGSGDYASVLCGKRHQQDQGQRDVETRHIPQDSGKGRWTQQNARPTAADFLK